MILNDLKVIPKTDPSEIIRLRDSVYASDLFITAVGHLNFFSWLASNPSTFNEILGKFSIKPRPTDVMLTLFKSLGLVVEKNEIFQVTDLVLDYLTDISGCNLIPYISTQTERPIVDKMLEVLKMGKPASWGGKKDEKDWATAMENEGFAGMFTAGMDSRGAYFAPGLAKSFDFSGYHSLIDIAGGSGIYALAVKARFPAMRAALLEKPPVNRIAAKTWAKKGLGNDMEIFGLDMFESDIPEGFDIHLFSHVLHDWDEEQNKQLIANSYKNLNPRGVIMIYDAHLDRDKSGPLSVAEYSVLLMFSTYGKCYSIGEMEKMLSEQGFRNIKYRKAVGNRSIITGQKI